uniref:Uncharacterized protein n=1 Tax=Anguilla anguilla TaxID=7936 RepID=A0A0E9SMD0_ANGAN
MKFVEVLCRLD